jgi:hypothetical protein
MALALDEVVSAERTQAAADERDVAGAVVGEHFPMLSPRTTRVSGSMGAASVRRWNLMPRCSISPATRRSGGDGGARSP